MEDKIIQGTDVNFEILFQGLPGLLVVLSPEFNILAASNAYLEATHKTREELLGRNLFQVFPSPAGSAKEKDSLQESLHYVASQKVPHIVPLTRYDLNWPESSKNLEPGFYWNLVNTPVLDKEGKLLYIVHEVRNITNLIKEEEQVKTSHDSLRLMAKIVGGAVWEYDMLKRKFTWSESYKTLFGYSDEDLKVKPDDWSFRVHPDDIAKTRIAIDKTITEKGKSWTGEYRYRRADNTYADVLDHGYILYEASGNPVRMLGSMIDLSKQKEYERELQVSNERFKLVARATNDVVWDWNMLDNSIWWSDGFKTLFGYEEEEGAFNIDDWMAHIHPSDLKYTETSLQNAINSGNESWECTYRFMCKDGAYKYINDKGYIVRDEDGQAIRMIGAMLDITEKQTIELQLQESNNRTRQVLESLPLMTWTAEVNGSVNYYSHSWYEYTGLTFEELRDRGWQEVLHPDDLENVKNEWASSIETGRTYETASRWRSKNGFYRWFLSRAVPIKDSFGTITSWVGSHTDIEEQKQLLLSVQESNRRTEFLAESIPQIVWTASPDGSIDYFNQRWYEYTNMPYTESLGSGWEKSVHPDDLEYATESWMHSMATGDKYEIELRLRNFQTDDYRWFLTRALPMRNDAGEIVKWFGTATDIHDFKLLHQQLKESNKQFKFLAESIPQMVWTTNSKGHHEYFNQRWVDYTGYTVENSEGISWSGLLHPDDRKRTLEHWQHCVTTGEYYEIEYRFRNALDGTYRWFLGQAMPMRNKAGKIVKWFGTCTDIEDHKHAEEELVEKNLELERINHDLDSFVYTASHDLKLPIVNMAGIFNELIRTAEFHDSEAPAMIRMFNKSLQQLHETIHDLSEVVRVQKEKDHALEQINLHELTEDVKVSIQDILTETYARIHTDFTDAPTIPFTRSSLKSVLYNLINNSIKYRDPSRVPEIVLTSSQKGNFIELKIQDNGIGIDMNKHQNKLFQMFKRFHNHVAGSGLGLYIVNRLLNNHGGYINIESTLHEGTTFYLYFKGTTSK